MKSEWASALRQSGQHRRAAHAYLFSGPPGLGQEDAALDLARALNCHDAEPGRRPCRQCGPCRRISAGVHPDVHIEHPVGSHFRTEQVKELLSQLSRSAFEGGWRVYVLAQAECLTMEAANRLLKILEEPPDQTVLVLSVPSPGEIAPTIVSRCQVITFNRWLEADLIDYLAAKQDLSETAACALARIAGGNPGRAEQLLRAGALSDLRAVVFGIVEKLAAGDLLAMFEAAQSMEKTAENDADFLQLFDAVWRDIQMCQAGMDSRSYYHCDEPDTIRRLADESPPVDLEGILTVSCQLRHALDARAARLLAYETACARVVSCLRDVRLW
ncbi:MAG: DNA polymerase III subunit delta' [Thermaerobacterales bacterium]